MMKIRGFIRHRFYSSRPRRTSNNSSNSSNSRYDDNNNIKLTPQKKNPLPYYKPIPDHCRHNCEACMMSRCPVPFRNITRDWQHCVKGSKQDRDDNLDFVHWVLLDPRGEPCYAI